MPRDGSQEYHAPFPDVVEGTTIESTVYNGFVNDIVIDLNTPRPVKYGGTGADNPADAMQNLGGELSKQLVTNYDAHPFQAGSFYSAAGASGAPVGNAFTGICYVAVIAGVATTDMFLEARDQTTGLLYVRQKKANVWGGWTVPAGFSPGPTPPVGSAPNALWWDTTRGKLFFYYQDPSGPPAQWVEAVAVPDIDPNTFVEIAGDSMTGFLTLNANAVNPLHAVPKQQLDARFTGLYAAPFDAMAYNGMQINGSMEVSQEKGSTATSVAGTALFIVDGWKVWSSGAQVVSGFQDKANRPDGYNASLQVTVTTANASPGVNDHCSITQNFEGYRISRLGFGTASASPITIGFWVASTRTGQHSGSVFESGGTRSCPFIFTVNATTGFEYKTVTIPGDTAGTWAKENTGSLSVLFSLMAGSSVSAPAGVWAAGLFKGATGSINCVASTSDHLLITGVVVLPGIEAPTAARSPLIMRPYDQELLTCKRYYYRLNLSPAAYVAVLQAYAATGANGFLTTMPVEMRADPAFATSSTAHFNLQGAGGGGPVVQSWNITASKYFAQATNVIVAGGLVAGNATMLNANTGAAWLSFDARL